MLYQTLETTGCKLLVAKNGETALAIAQKASPDLILLDIMLPGMHGFDVCKGLRDGGFRGPILFLTAKGEEVDKLTGFDIGGELGDVVVRCVVDGPVPLVVEPFEEYIEIVVAAEGDQVRVTVSDDGPAIPPDDVESIFEPYQRAKGGRESAASVGLGLSVSRQLARLMGGSLAYRHDNGRSNFHLTLPAQGDEA